MLEATMMIFGVMTVLTASGVIFSRKAMHSALFLVATLFLVAFHFALLGADFLAALQVLIYAGAIMVLVIFVIMLLGLREGINPEEKISRPDMAIPTVLATIMSGLMLGLLVFAFWQGVTLPEGSEPREMVGTAKAIGQVLFTKYLYPFELVSLLLLAAIIGAVVLAFDAKRPLAPGRGLKAMRE